VLSLCVSTQAPPQSAPPFAQVHAPPLQDWPAAQTVPHAPQWVTLVCGSTQSLPQSVSAAAHVLAQAPCEQTCPLGQVLPHAPQLVAFEAVLTQLPLQAMRPPKHWQLPALQL
jgi:hypothetical protein